MCMSTSSEFGVGVVAFRVMLAGDARPVIQRFTEAEAKGVAHHDEGPLSAPLAAVLGHRRDPAERAHGRVVRGRQRLRTFASHVARTVVPMRGADRRISVSQGDGGPFEPALEETQLRKDAGDVRRGGGDCARRDGQGRLTKGREHLGGGETGTRVAARFRSSVDGCAPPQPASGPVPTVPERRRWRHHRPTPTSAGSTARAAVEAGWRADLVVAADPRRAVTTRATR
jgi:hypothetical protein